MRKEEKEIQARDLLIKVWETLFKQCGRYVKYIVKARRDNKKKKKHLYSYSVTVNECRCRRCADILYDKKAAQRHIKILTLSLKDIQ